MAYLSPEDWKLIIVLGTIALVCAIAAFAMAVRMSLGCLLLFIVAAAIVRGLFELPGAATGRAVERAASTAEINLAGFDLGSRSYSYLVEGRRCTGRLVQEDRSFRFVPDPASCEKPPGTP